MPNSKTYNGILKLAADSSEKLRACDVFRVLDAAKNAGCLKESVGWLKKQPLRPGVAEEIDMVLKEEF